MLSKSGSRGSNRSERSDQLREMHSREINERQGYRHRMKQIQKEFLQIKQKEARQQERRREEHFRRHYQKYRIKNQPYDSLLKIKQESQKAKSSFHDFLLQDGLKTNQRRLQQEENEKAYRSQMKRSYIEDLKSQIGKEEATRSNLRYQQQVMNKSLLDQSMSRMWQVEHTRKERKREQEKQLYKFLKQQMKQKHSARTSSLREQKTDSPSNLLDLGERMQEDKRRQQEVLEKHLTKLLDKNPVERSQYKESFQPKLDDQQHRFRAPNQLAEKNLRRRFKMMGWQ